MQYNHDDIKILKGLEVIRKRPGFYIDTSNGNDGLSVIIEIIKTLFLSKYKSESTKVIISFPKYGGVLIKYNGKGMPIQSETTDGISHPIIYTSMLSTNFLFIEENKIDFNKYGHLCKIGAIINAVCEEITIISLDKDNAYSVSFSRGGICNLLEITDTKYELNQIYLNFDETIINNPLITIEGIKQAIEAYDTDISNKIIFS